MSETYKVDLHTHTREGSHDGGLTDDSIATMLSNGSGLQAVAVTDHNELGQALKLQQELGPRIIVGEEVSTTDGHLIGLFLKEVIPKGLSAIATATAIREQNGLVYVPHPFEAGRRKGLGLAVIETMVDMIDIVEGPNGRALKRSFDRQALKWAQQHHLPIAAGSDAHGRSGWGRTYNVLSDMPTRENLVELLRQAEPPVAGLVGLVGLAYPTFVNRPRKAIGKAAEALKKTVA